MQLVKEKAPYERVVVSRDEALAMFQENKFKVRIVVEGADSACPLAPFPSCCCLSKACAARPPASEHSTALERSSSRTRSPALRHPVGSDSRLTGVHTPSPTCADGDHLGAASGRDDQPVPLRPHGRPVSGAPPAAHRLPQGDGGAGAQPRLLEGRCRARGPAGEPPLASNPRIRTPFLNPPNSDGGVGAP